MKTQTSLHAVRMTVLMPWLMRSLGAVLKAAPWAYDWCRTRWSCATLAATLRPNIRDLVKDVEHHVQENGPCQYKLSHLCDIPEVTAAVEHIATKKPPKLAPKLTA